MNQETDIFFTESQPFAQWWIWLIVGGVAVLMWLGFIQQILLGQPMGNNPAPDWLLIVFWFALGILFPVFIYSCCLHIRVCVDGLYYRFVPIHRRPHWIYFQEIESYTVVTYHPIRDYGGWGSRYGAQGKAYNVSGNRGLQVELKTGERILFGSRKPDELKMALDAAMAQATDLPSSFSSYSIEDT